MARNLKDLYKKLIALEADYSKFLDKDSNFVYLIGDSPFPSKGKGYGLMDSLTALLNIEHSLHYPKNNEFKLVIKHVGENPLLDIKFRVKEGFLFPEQWKAYLPKQDEEIEGRGWVELWQAGLVKERLGTALDEERKTMKVRQGINGELKGFEIALRIMKLPDKTYITIDLDKPAYPDELYPKFYVVIYQARKSGFAEWEVVRRKISSAYSPVWYELWLQGKKEEVRTAVLSSSSIV